MLLITDTSVLADTIDTSVVSICARNVYACSRMITCLCVCVCGCLRQLYVFVLEDIANAFQG